MVYRSSSVKNWLVWCRHSSTNSSLSYVSKSNTALASERKASHSMNLVNLLSLSFLISNRL